jgi:hypothetical protein
MRSGASGRSGSRLLGFGKIVADRFASGPVGVPEGAAPREVAGFGLGQLPTAVLVGVVPLASRADVLLDGVTAAAVVAGVVEVATSSGASTAGTHTVPIPGLDVPGEVTAGEPASS